MPQYKLGEVEFRFANLIWTHEPLSSGTLVKLAEQELKWKKSTTYTILRRLCERGIFQNRDGIVSSLCTKKEYYAIQSEQFVDETFSGSLPQFLSAFSSRKKLSPEEIAEIQELIDQYRG